MSEFTKGLMGVPNGGANNSTGLVYHSIYRDSDNSILPPQEEIYTHCKTGEVRWHSESECFVPNQFHLNIATASIFVNVILLAIIVAQVLNSPKRKKGLIQKI